MLVGHDHPPGCARPEVRLELVDGVAIDDLGVPVTVGGSLGGELWQRGRLVVVPRHQHRADLLDRDADRRRVLAQQRVAAGDQPGLERPWGGVEAGVQDRGVGLAGAGADV